LVYLQDTAGDENWKVYSVNVASGETRLLTPESDVHAQLTAVSPDRPEEIVVGLNDRVPQLHDLYIVNLRTGERELLYQNEGLLGFLLDDRYNPRFASSPTADGGLSILARVAGEWQPFAEISMEDALTTGPAGLDPTGTKLYMIDSRGRDTAALTVQDLETGDVTVLYEDPRADVSHVMVHPTKRTIQAAGSTYEHRLWEILDPAIEGDLAYLNTVADGELNVISRSLDDQTWIVGYEVDDGPFRYYRYDR